MSVVKAIEIVEKCLLLDKVVDVIDNRSKDKRSETEENKETIELSLKDIAPIYTKFNISFAPTASSLKPDKGSIVNTGTQSGNPEKNTPTSAIKMAEERKPHELSEAAAVFYDEIIQPYQKHLTQYGMKNQIDDLVEIIDKQGDCPSILASDEANGDDEASDLKTIKDVLVRVTVKNHTFRVTRLAVPLALNEYGVQENHIPEVLLVALAHDIGKISGYADAKQSGRHHHAARSAEAVERLFANEDRHWIGNVTEAIRLHHETPKKTLGILLRDADRRARQQEISLYNKTLSVKPWQDWFNVTDYLAVIKSFINVIQTGQVWNSFSYDGVVYVKPDLLYGCAHDLATQKGVVDISLENEKDKEEAIGKIIKCLDAEKALADAPKEKSYGRYYTVETEHGPKKKMWLIALNLTSFSGFVDIEALKETYPPFIKTVKPI